MSENTTENQTETQKAEKTKLTPIDLRKASASQIELHIAEFEEFNLKAENFFISQRKNIEKELNLLYDVLRSQDYKQFIILQANALALKQTINEHLANYMSKLSRANANLKVATANRTEFYMTGYGIKVSDGLKNKLVDRDLSERERNIELFQIHIEFLRESGKNCDNIHYTVKNMIGLITYMNLEK